MSLPTETLRKIASYLEINVVDEHSSKDVLCVLIEDNLVKRNLIEDPFVGLMRNQYGNVFEQETPDFGAAFGGGGPSYEIPLKTILMQRKNLHPNDVKDQFFWHNLLEALKRVQLYVYAYPKYQKFWEKTIENSIRLISDINPKPRQVNNTIDYPYRGPLEDVLTKFALWRLKKELTTSIFSLKQNMPQLPKQIIIQIAFMNVLRECEKEDILSPRSLEQATLDIVFGGQTRSFLMLFPQWKIYYLAKLLNIDGDLPLYEMVKKGPFSYYCKKIKERVYLLEPKEVKSILQQDIERLLEEQKNQEEVKNKSKERYIPKYLDYVGGHRSVPTVEEWREKYKYEREDTDDE